MRIIKYQGGGVSLPSSYVDYRKAWYGILSGNSDLSSSSRSTVPSFGSDEKGSIGIFTKLMTDDVMEKVLPVDGRELIDMSVRFNSYIDPHNPALATAMYTSILLKLLLAKYEKGVFDKAVDEARERGALQGPAISDDGHVWVKKRGTITKIPVSKVKPSDRLVSVAELAQLRAYNPLFAGDASTIVAIDNSTSMKHILEYINSVVKDIGSSEVSIPTYATRLGVNQHMKLLLGLDDVMGTSIDGIYKLTVTKKSNTLYANALIDYVYATLERNQRAYLTVIAKKFGIKAKDDLGNKIDPVRVLLMLFILGKYETTSTYETSFEKEMTAAAMGYDIFGDKDGSKSGSKSGSDKELSDMESNPAMEFFRQIGEKIPVNMQIGRVHLFAIGTRGTLIDENDHPILGFTDLNGVAGSNMAFGMDVSNAHFGSARINDASWSDVVVNGATLVNVALPVDMQALQYNEIKPDFTLFDKVTEAQRKVGNIKDPRKVNEIYRSCGLPEIYDVDALGNAVLRPRYRQFAMMRAYADKDALLPSKLGGEIDFNTTIQQVKDSKQIDRIVKLIRGIGDKNKDYNPSAEWYDFIPGVDARNIYEGSIFIPINEDPVTYFTSSKRTAGQVTRGLLAWNYSLNRLPLLQQQRNNPTFKVNY